MDKANNTNGQANRYEPYRVKKEHKEFMVMMLARFEKPAIIARMLNDPAIADEYGFDLVLLNPSTVWKHCKKFKPELIEAVRAEWLSSIVDIPIAHKKWRLEQLLRIYYTTFDPKDRIAALKQAANEIGENFDKLADALKQSGDNHYHLHVNDDDRKQHKSNLESIFATIDKRRRFVVSDN